MAEVLPFNAVRPAGPGGALLERSYPSVEVLSPLPGSPPRAPPAAPAALLTDSVPGFYAYRQDFRTESGLEKNRMGLVGMLGAGGEGHGALLPIQETEAFGVERLVEEMSGTRTQEILVIAGYEDAKFKLDKILERGILERKTADVDVDAGGGERHRLWRIESPRLVADTAQCLRSLDCFLLDGLHVHRALKKMAGAVPAAAPQTSAPALAVFFNLLDFGMVFSSACLLLEEIPGFNINDTALRLNTFFETKAYPFSSARSLPKALAEFREDLRLRGFTESVIGALFRDVDQFFLFSLKDDANRDDLFLPDVKPPLREFDSVLLRRVILERYIGATVDASRAPLRIDYAWSVEEAVAAVRARRHRAAFFSNPPNKRKVMALSRSGFRLPPGSARVEPPVRAGLVMRRIE